MSSTDSPTKSLTDKVALVTGADRGIGHGIALEFGKRGASVVANYANSKEGSEKLVKEIESFGSKAGHQQNPGSQTSLQRGIDHFGSLDIVCSNAGKEVFCPEQEVTEELYDEVFALNARAQFFVAQQAFIHLNDGGRIILMSSVAATMSRL
jgi:3-oxoacyl-[acyl-carrier protein] reductase